MPTQALQDLAAPSEASFVRSALHTESGKEFIHQLNSHQSIDPPPQPYLLE